MEKKVCTLVVIFLVVFTNIFIPVVAAEESENSKISEQSENLNNMETTTAENDIEVNSEKENSEDNLENKLRGEAISPNGLTGEELSTNELTEEFPECEAPRGDVENRNIFVSDESGIKYYDSEGKRVSGEVTINGFVYCFNDEGYLKLGLQENSLGKSFYTDIDPYILVSEFQNIGDGTRYFDENGLMVFGCKEVNSKWYYFDENGLMYNRGWRIDEEKRYYYNEDGTLTLGTKFIDDSWYYFQNNGAMYTGWRTEGQKKYYYNEDGTLAIGVKKIGKYWYYFKNNGDMQKGWRNEGTKRYYYNSNGTLAIGVKKIGKYWHYFKNNGDMQKGWRNEGAKRYYYNSNGTLALGAKKIGTYWYYFKNNGDMCRGWRNEGKNKYYYDNSGRLQIGAKTINGQKYYFNKNGALAEDSKMCLKAQQYSSNTKWLILVDTKKNRVGIFNGSKGRWTQKQYWKCTSGAKATPTVKGQFTVGIKGKVFGKGYSCWYYTQFYGNYLFHSILYNPGSMTSIQDGRLGINASHGCVRLSLNNAKWIYNNIPKRTKVVVY